MKKILWGAVAALLIQAAHADSLMSIPETQVERIYIAAFCNASLGLKLTAAQFRAMMRWIAKYKPDIDCAKEQQPSLVNTEGDK